MKNALKLAKTIKLVIFDVDGVLTDGNIFLTNNNNEIKAFNTQDGLGIQLLLKTGIEVGIITSRQSNIVEQRMKALGIKHVSQGHLNKLPAYEQLLQKLNLSDKEVAYVGDDLPDLALLRRAQLGIATANANMFVQHHADWVTTKTGGQGAVREVCELIMMAQGTLDDVYNEYL